MEIDYGTYLLGLSKAPFDAKICTTCGGVGLRPIPGFDFEKCDCGIPEPIPEKIMEWAKSE